MIELYESTITLFQLIYAYPWSTQGYLRCVIFMEFIETSHACPDILGVGGWEAQILITFSVQIFQVLSIIQHSTQFLVRRQRHGKIQIQLQ